MLFLESELTDPFFELVHTFSVPAPGELHPAPFFIVTFPFLFGVMFGDMGHGLLLGLFAWLWGGRFRLPGLLCAFFSVYCGLIYNEFFGLKLDLFGSCFEGRHQRCVYPVGLDPVWGQSSNALQFTNSLKMKLSMVIACGHITLGLVLNLLNKFRARQNIALTALPKILIYLLTTGLICWLIVVKWLTHYPRSNLAPPIIPYVLAIYVGGQPRFFGTPEDSFLRVATFWAVLLVILFLLAGQRIIGYL